MQVPEAYWYQEENGVGTVLRNLFPIHNKTVRSQCHIYIFAKRPIFLNWANPIHLSFLFFDYN